MPVLYKTHICYIGNNIGYPHAETMWRSARPVATAFAKQDAGYGANYDSGDAVYPHDPRNVVTLEANEYPYSISFSGSQSGWLAYGSDAPTWGSADAHMYLCDPTFTHTAYLKRITLDNDLTHGDDSESPNYLNSSGEWTDLRGCTLCLAKRPVSQNRDLTLCIFNVIKVTIKTALYHTRCGDASNVAGPSITKDNFELTWTAGANGTNNAVNGYIVEYRDSSDGSTWIDNWTGSTTVTTNKITVSPNPTQGAYRQFRVKTTGAAGSDWYALNWAESNVVRTNINPNVPTNCSIAPTIYETGKITMTWTKSVKTTSDIVQYYIGFRTKAANGSWTAWAADAAIGNVASFEQEPSLSRGTQIQYRIRAIDTLGSYSSYVEFAVVTKNTQPGAPASLTVSPTLWESGNITFSWPAATVGTSSIDHYVIQVAVFNKTTNAYGSYVDVTHVTALTTTASPPSFDRGNKIRYRIIAVDTLGVSSASWTYSAEIKRNSLPVAPASLAVVPAVYESGNITLTWPAGTDADSNLNGYEISYAVSVDGTNWGNWVILANVGSDVLTYDHAPSTSVLPGGSYIKYRIRSKDSLNVYSSSYRGSSVVMKNSPSSAPVFVVPAVANALIESLTPAVKISYSSDPDGQSQTLYVQAVKNNVVEWSTSSTVGKKSGTFIARMDLPASGTYTIKAWVNDGFVDSDVTALDIRVSAAQWGRTISSGDVIADEIISHQEDINEMIEKANLVRAYYGLQTFTETGNGLFARWKPIMDDIAAKMIEAYAVAGETKKFDGATIYPSAASINAVRLLIAGA